MEKDTSISESIIYTVLTFLGFIRSDSPKVPEQKIPQVRRILPRTYVKYGSQALDDGKVIEVKASPLSYHRGQGWKKTAGVYRGYFRCRLGAFKGEVEERCNGDYKFYIFAPPEQVLQGEHKACFSLIGRDGRYHVHFKVNTNSLDGGVMAIERILSESLNWR